MVAATKVQLKPARNAVRKVRDRLLFWSTGIPTTFTRCIARLGPRIRGHPSFSLHTRDGWDCRFNRVKPVFHQRVTRRTRSFELIAGTPLSRMRTFVLLLLFTDPLGRQWFKCPLRNMSRCREQRRSSPCPKGTSSRLPLGVSRLLGTRRGPGTPGPPSVRVPTCPARDIPPSCALRGLLHPASAARRS